VSLPATIWGAIRLVHPAPTVAVTALSAVLGAILLAQDGRAIGGGWIATVAAVLGSQIFVGATNDLVDRDRDVRAGRRDKPLAAGELSSSAALWVGSVGLAMQLAASLRLGTTFLWLGLVATGSALIYNLWLSRTPASAVPYVVSFGVLPVWVAVGVGVDVARVAVAPLLVAPFAAAAHLANVVRDFDVDRAQGSRNLAQMIGRDRAVRIAWGLTMAVGVAVGVWLIGDGHTPLPALALGVVGLIAVAQGRRGPDALWAGMLVAAVCWTAAWALATG
jgi:4-hydroxybenzoate polyprenyltransferase